MEYLGAGSVRRMIEEYGPIKESVVIEYLEQILDGLTYIHNAEIIHSDLKCNFYSDVKYLFI